MIFNDFGIYCRMSLLVFSTAPFCQEESVSVKKIGILSMLEISLCLANSPPLSVVIDLRCFLKGLSSFMTVEATSSAFLPLGSFSIIKKRDIRSMMVRIKSFSFCMRSISKCPNSSLSSTLAGLCVWRLCQGCVPHRPPHTFLFGKKSFTGH